MKKSEWKTPSLEGEGKGDGYLYGRKPRTPEPVPIPWETHLARKRWEIGLIRARRPWLYMYMYGWMEQPHQRQQQQKQQQQQQKFSSISNSKDFTLNKDAYKVESEVQKMLSLLS